ncbi:putative saccharopine dehydrogenase (putative) [Phyllostomus discolor]|uniref:Putative saccharopine dehydrogenase (Putative) n=1 Tax=Phyllostomus discolor TaxID=89673 RepID=A0A833Y3S6_9CHIR|nr:putative saccharopine dehydrogenase (putative) [Phyllostomus discolor]
MFAGLFFLFFVRFGIGRQLLIKFPWLFSFGYFSKQGPTQKQMDATSFTMMFFGQGYSQGCSPEASKPNVRICTQVKGPGISQMTQVAGERYLVSDCEGACCSLRSVTVLEMRVHS